MIKKLLITLISFIILCTFKEAKPKKVQYRVKKGDTLISIARKYKVSVPELQRWNLLRSKDQIYSGQWLKIYRSTVRHKKRRIRNPSSLDFKPPVNIQAKIKNFILRYNRKFPGVLWKLKNSAVNSSRHGKVIEKGYLRGYGLYVIIDHGKGWLSFYSNLSRIFVNKGSYIDTGAPTRDSNEQKIILFNLLSWKTFEPC